MSGYVDEFVSQLVLLYPGAATHTDQLRDLAETVAELAAARASSDDLGIAVAALNELVDAASTFSPWRDRSKVTVFGSARVRPGDAHYELAVELSSLFAERGWLTVSGGGPGIMEAAAKGAGREHTLGVNINLPFEQGANDFIDAESRLVETKYFFTRKVALTRESLGYVFFPGGLGTLDELYEILTLLHTGKTRPAPVVLIDRPGGTYWRAWLDFMLGSVVSANYLDDQSVQLFELVYSVAEAVGAIESFYANFVTFDQSHGRGEIQLRRRPSPELLDALEGAIPRFSPYVAQESSLTFDFDGRHYVSLRRVIDQVNRF